MDGGVCNDYVCSGPDPFAGFANGCCIPPSTSDEFQLNASKVEKRNRLQFHRIESSQFDIDLMHFFLQDAPALPKTRSGKIMRRILRKIAADDKDLGNNFDN